LRILVLLLMLFVVLPVFAEPLSDRTGLKTTFSVIVNSKPVNIETTANFDVRSISFDDGTLVIQIISSLENNIGELQIPNELRKGELLFLLDGAKISPKVLQNDKISFVTLEFVGNGTHTLEIKNKLQNNEQFKTPISSSEGLELNQENLVVILAVIGVVAATGSVTTIVVYLKRKKS